MSEKRKQMEDVFQWLGAPDIALFKLVQEAANSTSQHTSLVLAAQTTLCIVHAVQHTNAPEVQLLVKHAVRVVGLLCRAYMEKGDGKNWHTEGGQILVDLLILFPKILNLVNKVRLFDTVRTAVYLEELQFSMVKVASLVTRPHIRFERSAVGLEASVEREEEQVTVAARRKTKGRAGSPFAPSPTPVPHPTASPPYPTGYPLPALPPLRYDTTDHLQPSPSMPQAFPSSGEVYFVPYCPPASVLSNYNSGNTQNINITNHHHYFGTPGRGSTRRRKSSVRDQLRMVQDIIQSTSPPYWDVPPHTTFANYPPYGGHPFMPVPPMHYSVPLASGPYPAASFPSSLSNLEARTVPNISTMNPSPNSHQNGSCSRL